MTVGAMPGRWRGGFDSIVRICRTGLWNVLRSRIDGCRSKTCQVIRVGSIPCVAHRIPLQRLALGPPNARLPQVLRAGRDIRPVLDSPCGYSSRSSGRVKCHPKARFQRSEASPLTDLANQTPNCAVAAALEGPGTGAAGRGGRVVANWLGVALCDGNVTCHYRAFLLSRRLRCPPLVRLIRITSEPACGARLRRGDWGIG